MHHFIQSRRDHISVVLILNTLALMGQLGWQHVKRPYVNHKNLKGTEWAQEINTKPTCILLTQTDVSQSRLTPPPPLSPPSITPKCSAWSAWNVSELFGACWMQGWQWFATRKIDISARLCLWHWGMTGSTFTNDHVCVQLLGRRFPDKTFEASLHADQPSP